MSRRQNSLLVSPLPVEKKTKQSAVVVEEDADVLIAKDQGGSDEDESHDTVFKSKCKTKEETANAEEGYSTMMMIVFAVILVVLVCLIVWMVVSTNESKKNEDELKGKLTHHPQHMPPNFQGPPHMLPNFQVPPHMQHMHNMQMQQMHMMQSQANLNPKAPISKLRVEEVEEPQNKENMTVEAKPAVKESKKNEDEEITADYLNELSKKTNAIIKDGNVETKKETKKEEQNNSSKKNSAEWNSEDTSSDEKMKRSMEEESEELLTDDY